MAAKRNAIHVVKFAVIRIDDKLSVLAGRIEEVPATVSFKLKNNRHSGNLTIGGIHFSLSDFISS
jgi:hypothetical protein